MATHSGVVTWRIPMDKGAWPPTVHGLAKSQTCLSDKAHMAQSPHKDALFRYLRTSHYFFFFQIS